MYRKFFFIAVGILSLILASCSDDGEKVVGHYTADGKYFSEAEFQGNVSYLRGMVPKQVLAITLDYDLNPVDTLEMELKDSPSVSVNYKANTYFYFEGKDLASPYLKIVTLFPMEGSSKTMEFSQYADVTEATATTFLKDNGSAQDLVAALAFDRMTILMKDKKLSFRDARQQALQEILKGMGYDDETGYAVFNAALYQGVEQSLEHGVPYYFCRYFVSDSVFYSDFKNLRERIAKGVLMDSIEQAKLADALFKSMIPDSGWSFTSKGLRESKYLETFARRTKLFNKVYNDTLGKSVSTETIITLRNKYSQYDGVRLVKDDEASLCSLWGYWRVWNVMEDTLGICRNSQSNLAHIGDRVFRCERKSSMWILSEDGADKMTVFHGRCSRLHPENGVQWLSYEDSSLWACLCSENDCVWSKEFKDSDFQDKSDTLYLHKDFLYRDASAARELGRCEGTLDKKRFPLDSSYVRCEKFGVYRDGIYFWREIDSLSYELGVCVGNSVYSSDYSLDKMVKSSALDYYVCTDSGWTEILPTTYYHTECNYLSHNKIAQYEGLYYICKAEQPWLSTSAASWERLSSRDSIPPILKQDKCTLNQVGTKISYDGIVYYCNIDGWGVALDYLLTPPEKEDGLLCVDSLIGKEFKYGDDYYACEKNGWKKLDDKATALRDYEALYGVCEDVKGGSIYWNERAAGLYSCIYIFGKYQWVNLFFSGDMKPPEGMTEKDVAGGIYESDSLYVKEMDGVVYEFKRRAYVISVESVTLNSKKYDAYFYSTNLFVREKASGKDVLITDVQDASACFEKFVGDWSALAQQNSVCGDSEWTLDLNSVTLVGGQEGYVTWDVARVSCPSGYHIPDTTEFMGEKYLEIPVDSRYMNTNPIQWTYENSSDECHEKNTFHANIFWSATEKDSDTQYCVELLSGSYGKLRSKRTVECPKDLYPLVQSLCVRNL